MALDYLSLFLFDALSSSYPVAERPDGGKRIPKREEEVEPTMAAAVNLDNKSTKQKGK